MRLDKKKNAVAGTFWGLIQKVIAIVFPFINRTVIIYTLGVEYLGLTSLFSSILQVLNLAELGVSSALVFSMYKPIAEDNTDKIRALIKFYKNCYRVIGFIILVIGLILTPIIPYLISGEVSADVNIFIIYLMNLGSTVLSYWLFAYRSSLFIAHQRNDILSIIGSIIAIVINIIQMICLVIFKNYYLYLGISILGTVALNIITAIASKKYYPQYIPHGELPIEEKKEIWRKVRDLFAVRIGGVINHSADTIVISAFLGLETLAVYQNYYYITSAIYGFFMVFYAACDAGIANSLIISSKDVNRQLLYNINHISFFALNFCCVCLICIYQPFMELWVGKEYVLDFSYVVLFSVYLFAEIAPRTLIVYKDAAGIWRSDRFRPLTVAMVNLASNLLMVRLIGLYGILISTIMSMLFVGFPWLIHNIEHYLIDIGILRYLKRVFEYIVVILICSCTTYWVCNLMPDTNVVATIFIRLAICVILPNFTFTVMFFKTKENKYLMSIISEGCLKLGVKIKK